ncbi:MAG: amidohydrolase [Clostridia bacterium]|nr:amidohydrolase [Clostridia bacterium]
MNILLKNIDILTCDDSNMLIKNGFIGIQNGIITFVSTSLEELNGFVPDKIIEGKNRIAMPGLVNSHTHCAMTLLRNSADDLALEDWLFKNIFPTEAKLTKEDIYWGTLLGIAEMIKSGTTTFADMYFHMEDVAKAVSEAGIRANLSISPIRFGSKDNYKLIDNSSASISYYNNWNNTSNGRIKVYLEVHSTYIFDEPSLKSAAALAKQLGTGIHIHLLETLNERENSIKKYGMNSAEICDACGIFDVPVFAAHCVHLSETDMDILKAKNVYVSHNPTSNLKLGSGIAPIPRFLEKGITVGLGTDGPASNNNLNMFEEMHLAALIHKGMNKNPELMNAEQTMRMATVNGAAAIGFENEVGVLKKGMKADIIILNTDKPHLSPSNNLVSAIVYAAQASDVETVIIDGNIVMEDRKLKTMDEEKIIFEVNAIAKRLFG